MAIVKRLPTLITIAATLKRRSAVTLHRGRKSEPSESTSTSLRFTRRLLRYSNQTGGLPGWVLTPSIYALARFRLTESGSRCAPRPMSGWRATVPVP